MVCTICVILDLILVFPKNRFWTVVSKVYQIWQQQQQQQLYKRKHNNFPLSNELFDQVICHCMDYVCVYYHIFSCVINIQDYIIN